MSCWSSYLRAVLAAQVKQTCLKTASKGSKVLPTLETPSSVNFERNEELLLYEAWWGIQDESLNTSLAGL